MEISSRSSEKSGHLQLTVLLPSSYWLQFISVCIFFEICQGNRLLEVRAFSLPCPYLTIHKSSISRLYCCFWWWVLIFYSKMWSTGFIFILCCSRNFGNSRYFLRSACMTEISQLMAPSKSPMSNQLQTEKRREYNKDLKNVSNIIMYLDTFYINTYKYFCINTF